MKSENLKESILTHLNELVEKRIEAANQEIQSIYDSKANETKSSAGDKYETGMAMLQIEEQKLAVQLAKAKEFKQVLSRIDYSNSSDSVQLGSLVVTNQGLFYFSIAIGKMQVDKTEIFVLSMGSPLGQALKGQKLGYKANFNGNTIEIVNVY
jgi:transcription elongation GreA/GreB family factor